ncbi:hypothetical protein HY003_02285 [Candidatus Saccharibacteria bacterium]|nr:hypothetical protein [Candidatus Saccharibacteria bacterium]MBI3338105.1 hypothetical protein [Candidatus Saccharibacteria bacterium]
MSLTKDDLAAIKDIVEGANEDLRIDVATGFAEVHDKFAEIHDKFAEVHDKFAEVHDKIDHVAKELSAQIDSVDDKLTVRDGKLEDTVRRVDELQISIAKLTHRTV